MLNNIKTCIACICVTILVLGSCKKWDDYKKYTAAGEIVYPAAASGVTVLPGNGRVLLTWVQGIDTKVKKYVVYWANGADSTVLTASSTKTGDTVKYYIDHLEESTYSFTIYTIDDQGHRSVPTEMPPLGVYGPKYAATLLNRAITSVAYEAGAKMLTIAWGAPDTVNINTEIWYTDTLGVANRITLGPTDDTTQLPWNMGSSVYYRSAYKPVSIAIDSFEVTHLDSVKIENLPVPKNAWKEVHLPNDAVTNAYGTNLSNIWDGAPAGYPDIYHTDGAAIPHHFTFDLGQTYAKLTKFAEWGRQDGSFHNPDDFEVWGIADTTGAATTLPGDDPGWKAESVAKGWTLLTEVKRTDDGIGEVQVNLIAAPPPVRFIRIRVLHTVDDNTASHMSEISFWYNP